MTICIGHMGGRGWRAELDFDDLQAAIIIQPHRGGGKCEVATVPLGDFTPETDDNHPQLDPADEQNKRLMSLVFAPDAWDCLRNLHAEISKRLRDIGYIGARDLTAEQALWADAESDMVNEIETVLALLAVPGEGE